MKSLKLASAATALVLSTSVSAALIDNGAYTTDDDSGLDWLDLTVTAGTSYDDTSLGFSTYEGGGWRYATNDEVVNLFGTLFNGYYDTNSNGSSDSASGASYSSQSSDMLNFFSLLGSWNYTVHTLNYGLYRDETDTLRMIGGWCYTNSCASSRNVVYGTDFSPEYDATAYYSNPSYGTYLVRNNPSHIPSVPVPAAVWLFGSGLIGLVGFARRKKA